MKRALIIAALIPMALSVVFADTAAKSTEWITPKADLANPIANTTRGYTANICRTFADKHEEQLLKKAEATYPKREVVLKAMTDAPYNAEKAPPADTPLWWWYSDSVFGIRLPYAITTSAVKYYNNLISDFTKGDFSGSKKHKMVIASLKYRSKIEHHDKWTYNLPTVVSTAGTASNGSDAQTSVDYEDVYVVDMSLEWIANGAERSSARTTSGEVPGMGFAKQRVVVLANEGSVLAVYGDGPAIVNIPITGREHICGDELIIWNAEKQI